MTENATDFVAYEYLTIKADRELEPLYRDAYRNFGWVVDGYSGLPQVNTVTLKFKRDRRIPNRAEVVKEQVACEHALATISSLERSKTSTPVAVALAVGIVGSAFLAGSVFAITANLWLLGIPLGIVGLAGWAAGYLAHRRTKASRQAKVAPLIDREYDVVYSTGEQANRLLA